MTDVFEPSENGPSETKVVRAGGYSPVALRVPEVYCPAITDPLKLMYSIPHKITTFLVPLYQATFCHLYLGNGCAVKLWEVVRRDPNEAVATGHFRFFLQVGFLILSMHLKYQATFCDLRRPKGGLTPRQQLATCCLQHFLVMLPVITKKCCRQHVANCCLGVTPPLHQVSNRQHVALV
jgi:hypothetical protein